MAQLSNTVSWHGPTRFDTAATQFDTAAARLNTVAARLNTPAPRLLHHHHGSSHQLHGRSYLVASHARHQSKMHASSIFLHGWVHHVHASFAFHTRQVRQAELVTHALLLDLTVKISNF